jgi:hypothetical protein
LEKLNYQLKVGNNYKYIDKKGDKPLLCTLVRITNDGNYAVYEFKHYNSRAIGSTIYPEKLKRITKELSYMIRNKLI